MVGDIDAAAEPDAVEPAHVLQEPDQPHGAAWPADQSIVQADGQELRRSLLALVVEQVEGVAHVGEEVVGGGEAAVLVEAVVVGFVGVRNHEVRTARHLDPVGQFVGQRIPVVEKAALLRHEPPRVRSRPAGHPAERTVAQNRRQPVDGPPDVIALNVLRHLHIVDPAVAMADHLVPVAHEGAGKLRVLLQRAHHAEHADLDVVGAEDLQHPPHAASRAVLEHRFDQRHPLAGLRLHADVVEHALRNRIAVDKARLAAALDVEIEVDRDARAARPGRVRQRLAIADEIAFDHGIGREKRHRGRPRS